VVAGFFPRVRFSIIRISTASATGAGSSASAYRWYWPSMRSLMLTLTRRPMLMLATSSPDELVSRPGRW